MFNAYVLGFASLLVLGVAIAGWIRAIYAVSIIQHRTLAITTFALAALLACATFFNGADWISGTAAGVSLLVSVLFFVTIAIGKQTAANPQGIAIGEPLPHFTTLDEFGETFDSQSLIGNPALIKFFRGHW